MDNEQEKNGSQASSNDEDQENVVDLIATPRETPNQLRERLIASGFPLNYIDSSPTDYITDENNREAMRQARAFVENPKGVKGLYICGPYGTGKTWLAVLIGRICAEHGNWVLFDTFTSLTNKLLQARNFGEEYARLMTRYTKNADILFIDDIGKEKPSEWKLQTLFDIIDTREGNHLPTVFTSNYSLTDLCERITPANSDNITAGAIRSRLGGKNSPEKYVPLVLGGEDRR